MRSYPSRDGNENHSRFAAGLRAPLPPAAGGGAERIDARASSPPRTSTATSRAQIGGAHVDVTSILSDPNADPHLFEPGIEQRARRRDGARRDPERRRLRRVHDEARERLAELEAHPSLTIADVLGVHGRDANPHLWYDVPRAQPDRRRDRRAARARRSRARDARIAPGSRRFDASLRRCEREVARDPRALSAARPSPTPSPSRATCSTRRGLREPRAGRVHARDRGRNGAVAAGRRRDGRADDEAARSRCCSTTARRSPPSRARPRRRARRRASRSSASPRRCRRS